MKIGGWQQKRFWAMLNWVMRLTRCKTGPDSYMAAYGNTGLCHLYCLSSPSSVHSSSSCQRTWRMGMASFWMSLKEAVCLLTLLAGRLLINQRISTFSAHAFAQNISWSHSAHRSMLRGLGASGVYFAFVTRALFDPFCFPKLQPSQVQLVFHRGTSIWACTKWLK